MTGLAVLAAAAVGGFAGAAAHAAFNAARLWWRKRWVANQLAALATHPDRWKTTVYVDNPPREPRP